MDGGLVTMIVTVFAENPVLALVALAGAYAGWKVLRVWARVGGGYNAELVEK